MVVIKGDNIVDHRIIDTGVNVLENASRILQDIEYDRIVATGYGRYLIKEHIDCPVITEIKAFAQGAHFLCPDCRTVIDIGGQDSKVISVDRGRVVNFEMNDRCAAGTGRFLEIMAHTLGFTIGEFAGAALNADTSLQINSMCTVFAESEVVSLIAQGKTKNAIANGLHRSITQRISAMVGRIGSHESIVFAGGVAKNTCMATMLGRVLKSKLIIPDNPQITGAIGAALTGLNVKIMEVK